MIFGCNPYNLSVGGSFPPPQMETRSGMVKRLPDPSSGVAANKAEVISLLLPRGRRGSNWQDMAQEYGDRPCGGSPLARCTPRNQTQTPAKRRYECNACNTLPLDIAS